MFGGIHQARFDIPSVSLEEARKYNPAFGKTYADLRGKPLPVDVEPNHIDKPSELPNSQMNDGVTH